MIRNLPPGLGELIWDIKTTLSGLHLKAKASAFINVYWACPWVKWQSDLNLGIFVGYILRYSYKFMASMVFIY